MCKFNDQKLGTERTRFWVAAFFVFQISPNQLYVKAFQLFMII